MTKGGQVSVYVRAEDRPLWERAEEHARKRRLSMSALVMTALEEYLERHETAEKPPKGK